MAGIYEIKSLDEWLKLTREQKIETLFKCPNSWRCSQAKDLWGDDAYGYGSMVNIPYGVSWEEIVKVVFSTDQYCKITLNVKPEYISDIGYDEFMEIVKKSNKPGKPCKIDPRYAGKEYIAFCAWRREKYAGKSMCFFDAEKFDDNSLILIACTEQGDQGDEWGFGVEPDMWTSAIFDLQGNPIKPFQPGIIG